MTFETMLSGIKKSKTCFPGIMAALFFGLNVAGIENKSLWIDEMRTGYATLDMTFHEFFRYILLNDPGSPFYSFIVAMFCRIFGHSEMALRLPSLALGAAAIIAFWFLASRLVSKSTAVIAVFLMCLSMNMVYFSMEARSYSFFLLLSIIAYILALDSVEKNRPAYTFALVCVLGFYTNIMFALVAMNCVLYAFLFRGAGEADRPRAHYRLAASAMAAFLLYLPWLCIFMAKSIDMKWLPSMSTGTLKTLALIFGGLIVGNAYTTMKIVSLCAFAGIALWLYGLARLRSASPGRFKLLLLWMFAPIIFFVALSSLARNSSLSFFHHRYLLHILPFFILSIASGISLFLSDIFGRNSRLPGKPHAPKTRLSHIIFKLFCRIAYAVLLMFFVFGTIRNLAAYRSAQHQDWRGAFRYINSKMDSRDIVVMQGIAYSSMNFYVRSEERAWIIVPTNSIGKTNREFAAHRRKWFVYYQENWDVPLLSRSNRWLDSIAVETKTFPGLYGNINVGFSDAYTLVNAMTLQFHPGAGGNKTRTPDNSNRLLCPKATGLCEAKGFNAAGGSYLASAAGDFAGRMRISQGQTTYTFDTTELKGYGRVVKLRRGSFKIECFPKTRARKKFTVSLRRRIPIKIIDQGTGPEMGEYYLNWIRK